MRIKRSERILMAIGLILLAVWVASEFHKAVSSQVAIASFEADTQRHDPVDEAPTLIDPILGSQIDFRLWSTKRISAYLASLVKKTDTPLAILRIPRINLEVPVFNGTDDLTLNRGVGRILGTAQVGQSGNLGIAGHRDGFFRRLQSIAPNDLIELVLSQRTDTYLVRQISIVAPEDVYVLNPASVPTLTLVTCFPFYFVGQAPKRYIVEAHINHALQHHDANNEHNIFTVSVTENKEKSR